MKFKMAGLKLLIAGKQKVYNYAYNSRSDKLTECRFLVNVEDMGDWAPNLIVCRSAI